MCGSKKHSASRTDTAVFTVIIIIIITIIIIIIDELQLEEVTSNSKLNKFKKYQVLNKSENLKTDKCPSSSVSQISAFVI